MYLLSAMVMRGWEAGLSNPSSSQKMNQTMPSAPAGNNKSDIFTLVSVSLFVYLMDMEESVIGPLKAGPREAGPAFSFISIFWSIDGCHHLSLSVCLLVCLHGSLSIIT